MACCIALSDDAYMHMQLPYNRLIKKQASIEQTGVVFRGSRMLVRVLLVYFSFLIAQFCYQQHISFSTQYDSTRN